MRGSLWQVDFNWYWFASLQPAYPSDCHAKLLMAAAAAKIYT
ncbi:16960_t:CDS:2 [Acaulospora colombiana]|uniref:16960_t:CDS:1 n=1 Tax=Acaulospora colombiana TaxID=27376 RepID=A0ACA9LBV2_9GLOM|nr:16960_t:CDS:2 [Acaulospora colombiana]